MLLTFFMLLSADDGWQVARKTARTLVERRPHLGGLMETRATSETDVPAEKIAEVFWHPPPKQRLEAVKKRVLIMQDDTQKVVYFQLRLPVVKDRDYTVRVKRFVEAEQGRFRFESRCESTAGPAETPDHVRVYDCHAMTVIERRPNGRTFVSYVAFANPAGRLPHWIVNMLAPKTAADVLERLIDDARETPPQ